MVLAEHLSAETKAKLKQSRTMKNYAQGSKYHIEFIKFICQIHLMIFLSLMFNVLQMQQRPCNNFNVFS